MMITDYIGKTINFNTLAASVLGVSRTNVQVQAVLDLDTSMLLGDVRSKHTQVRNYIPSLPVSPSMYTYIKIKHPSGRVEILGVPWIDHDSIEIVSEQDLIIRVKVKSAYTETTIKKALLQNGIEDFTIETVAAQLQ